MLAFLDKTKNYDKMLVITNKGEKRMEMTSSLEDYLNAIYLLSKEGEGARVTDISNFLKVKKSSTNKALNVLKEDGLIYYEKYQNITLTEIGFARAKYIHRRHELFEIFLRDIIKTDENLVQEETEQLAHCISCHTAAKLQSFIEEYLQK